MRLIDWLFVPSLFVVAGAGVWAGLKLTPEFLVVLTIAGALAWYWNVVTGTKAPTDHITFRPWLFAAIPFFLIVAWCVWFIATSGIFRH